MTQTRADTEEETSRSPDEGAVTTPHEEPAIDKRLRPSALMLFEIVRREGAEELTRPSASLFWSGLAGGLALSFSLAATGMIHAATEPGTAQNLLTPLGYVIGFLIVVFGRLQLFTENTIAAILPLAADFTAGTLRKVLKLNIVVFTANIAGALLAAIVISLTPVVQSGHFDAMLELSRKAMDRSAMETLVLGIPAGFLVAAMVWMLPAAKGAEVFVVTAIIYTLGLGEFAHVIVGAVEAGLMVAAGEASAMTGAFGFVIPALIGNIIGGTALFAVLAYAQIRDEVRKRGNTPKA